MTHDAICNKHLAFWDFKIIHILDSCGNNSHNLFPSLIFFPWMGLAEFFCSPEDFLGSLYFLLGLEADASYECFYVLCSHDAEIAFYNLGMNTEVQQKQLNILQ